MNLPVPQNSCMDLIWLMKYGKMGEMRLSHLQIWRKKLLERLIRWLHETIQAGGTEDDSTFFSHCSHACLLTLADVKAAPVQCQNVQWVSTTKRIKNSQLVYIHTKPYCWWVVRGTRLDPHSSCRLMKATLVQNMCRTTLAFITSLWY